MPKIATVSIKRVLLIVVPLLCVMFPAYSLARGHLAPFSPWVVGFQYRDFERARVYYHSGTDIEAFAHIDRLVGEVEAAHGMRFPRKVEIIVSSSDTEHERLASTRARFQVMPLYARLFVSRRAQEDAKAGKIHMDVYMRHELSHSLLFQNMTLVNSLRCPDWLLEGLAVYTSNQRGWDGYFTKDEVAQNMRQGYFLHPADFILKPWKRATELRSFPLANKYWFIYSEMACLIEDLIQTRGQDTFRFFLDGVMKDGDAYACFARVYGESFETYAAAFRERMLASGSKPVT